MQLFVKNPKGRLLLASSFSNEYNIIANNVFVMGKENPVVETKTNTTIKFSQEVNEKNIHNRIEVVEITGTTGDGRLRDGLDKMLMLQKISPVIILKRDLKGRITEVVNKEALRSEFDNWVKEHIAEVFAEKKSQDIFQKNYLNGLDNLERHIASNFQYMLLMPEVYHFRPYTSPNNYDKTRAYRLASKLVADMELWYFLENRHIERSELIEHMMVSKLLNRNYLEQQFLKKLYKQQTGLSVTDFHFQIEMRYKWHPETYELISAGFKLIERMHDHLSYTYHIDVQKKEHE